MRGLAPGVVPAPPGLVPASAVAEAARRIRGVAVRTPLLEVPDLIPGLALRLKCESLQRTGSFKLRGAWNLISRLGESALRRGVVTYSSGNHGQAVALAARLAGTRAVVVTPTTVSPVKREGGRALGAEIVVEGTTSEERKARAEALAREEGLALVPPFDHPLIIAGQGTVGLEVLEAWPQVETVVVPVGGGGLVSGCAVAIKGRNPRVRVVGVEPVGAASMTAALEAGAPVTLERVETAADGLAPVRAGALTFAHVNALVDQVVTVEEEAIREAARLLLLRGKLLVEFAGAAAVAALRSGAVSVREGERVVAVVSGGNADPRVVREWVAGAP